MALHEQHEKAGFADGRRLFALPCIFVAAAPRPRDLPPPDLPEVAFAGRSNCGKSSLINALVGRKGLARASQTPGRTQSVNVFELGGRLRLIDLPGYGYARAGRVDVARWASTVDRYLAGRPTLRRVCLLMDARRGPTESDLAACDHMEATGTAYQVVLTRTDKLKAVELEAVADATRAQIAGRPAANPAIVATSARKGTGIERLREELAALAAPEPLTRGSEP
jgi:GTP-binding protein